MLDEARLRNLEVVGLSYSHNQKTKRNKRLAKGLCPGCRTPLDAKTRQCPKRDTTINWEVCPPRVRVLSDD